MSQVSDVPVEDQLAVIDSVKQALDPKFQRIPTHIVPLLTPPSGGVAAREGGFAHRTAAATDIAEVVSTGTEIAIGPLLAPERLNRVAQQSQRVLDSLLEVTVAAALRTLDQGYGGHGNGAPAESSGTATAGAENAGGLEFTARTSAHAVLHSFENALCSATVHEHVRFAALESLSDIEPSRPLLKRRWDDIIESILRTDNRLPSVPPGAPI